MLTQHHNGGEVTEQQAQLHRIPMACERLGVGRSTVFELIRTGELHSVKIGRRRLIPETAITEYINRLVAGSAAA